jgi:hypothetical protein
MGAIGGPNVTPPTATSRGGNDDFGGSPVDVVFKYEGVNGNGDPGIIDPPTNALRMTNDLTTLSAINNHPMRVAIVEYTAQMSGGAAFADFTNVSTPDPVSGGSYLMGRHFITLAAGAIALNDRPVTYNSTNYYGSLILNPDLLGQIQQVNAIGDANRALPANSIRTAADQALCFLTQTRSYRNVYEPNTFGGQCPGQGGPKYCNKTYVGAPVKILEEMLADGYPAYSFYDQKDAYWNVATNNLIGGTGNTYSQAGTWFNSCVANPTYNKRIYNRPNFPAGFEGWIEANNWLIRTFSPIGNVTFGWQENMWSVSGGGGGWWLNTELTDSEIMRNYSTPVSSWLQTNARSSITTGPLGRNYVPDFFVFDRYETDDSASPNQATLYNARSWDNYLSGVAQISKNFNNIPVMIWQIPGSHLPYVGEAAPEIWVNPETGKPVPGNYVFSTAPVYFFGDGNLKADLSNLIAGAGASTNSAVGNYLPKCSADPKVAGMSAYGCQPGSNYKNYLLAYQGKPNNYNWGKDNSKLTKAAAGNVFAILWGGGNTTNVIKNFSNTDDHRWLANKIINYYKNPIPVVSYRAQCCATSPGGSITH